MTAVEEVHEPPVEAVSVLQPMVLVSRPSNVITALHAVMAEVGGIEKKRGENHEDGAIKYKFRGIDAISQAAQPLLGKHGVVIVPKVVEQTIVDITVNRNPWTDTFVTVEWTLYGPGGVDDKIVAETTGIGRDNSDKGVNKAMTGAFKNLLLRILCIGDPADDTDGITNETDAPEPPAPPVEHSTESLELYARMSEVVPGSAMATVLKAAAAREGKKLNAPAFDADPLWRNEVAVLLSADVQIIDSNGRPVIHVPVTVVTVNEADLAPVDPAPANGHTDDEFGLTEPDADGPADTVAAPGGSTTVVDPTDDEKTENLGLSTPLVVSDGGDGTADADTADPAPGSGEPNTTSRPFTAEPLKGVERSGRPAKTRSR